MPGGCYYFVMHELAITQQILEIALRHADAAGGGQVTDLYLVIGELASYVDESVQFYWDIISQETACAGARLHFTRRPARLKCRLCNCEYGLDNGMVMVCPDCRSSQISIMAGEEFYLEAIDVASQPAKAGVPV